jgi:hypothetical protein
MRLAEVIYGILEFRKILKRNKKMIESIPTWDLFGFKLKNS